MANKQRLLLVSTYAACIAVAFSLAAGCKKAGTTADNSGGGGGDSTATGRRPMVGTGNAAKNGTITIGLVASETGDQKPWGEDSIKGAQLELDDFNKAGGLKGYKITLDIQDSQSTPAGAGNAAAKLISDGSVGIVGEVSSGNTIEIANRGFTAGVPVVAIGATKTSLTQTQNNVFRVCYPDSFQGGVMANFAYNELGYRKIGVLTDNKLPYSQGLSEDFIKTFTALGGKIVDQEKYETGASTFSTQLTQLKAANPDAVFCSGYFTEVGPIVAAAHQIGLDVKFLGGDGWDSPKILSSGGKAILGDYFCNHYTNMDPSPEVQNFLKEWIAKYGSAPGTTMGALAYDAMKVTLTALTQAKTLDSVGLRNALANIQDLKCVSGTITLKGNNGTPNKRALVVQIVPMGPLGFQKPVVAYEPDPKTGAINKIPLGSAAGS